MAFMYYNLLAHNTIMVWGKFAYSHYKRINKYAQKPICESSRSICQHLPEIIQSNKPQQETDWVHLLIIGLSTGHKLFVKECVVIDRVGFSSKAMTTGFLKIKCWNKNVIFDLIVPYTPTVYSVLSECL